MKSALLSAVSRPDPVLSFRPPLAALRELRAAARGSREKVAVSWEREDGNVYRFDVPLPERIAPKAMPGVRRLVERVAKFALWSAGGWRLRIAGPDAVVRPIVRAYAPKGERAFDVRERERTVVRGIALAELVEVRTVDEQDDGFSGGHGVEGGCRAEGWT